MQTATALGFAIEIAGGVLLASSVLTFDPKKLRGRGGTFPGAGGTLESHLEPARGIAGLVVLTVGFLVQLAATIGCTWWLWPAAVVAGGAAYALGWLAGTKVIAPWLQRRGSS